MLKIGPLVEDKPGLRDYWQIFLRRKWLIILPLIAIPAIAIPGSVLMTPVYQASTTLISQEVERGSILRGVANIPVPRGEEMNTVRYKIETRSYMKDVADKVGIAEYLRSIGKPSTLDDVVRYLREIITLRARSSKIIEIFVMHQNPDMAKNIADTIANTYVNKTMDWRQQATTDSTSFINEELEVYKKQLNDAEEAYRKAQEEGVLDSLGGEDSSLNKDLAKLRTDRIEVEMDLREANNELQNARTRAAGNVTEEGSSSTVYTNPEIASLQARLAGLETQYAELSRSFTDQWPAVKTLQGEIIQVQDKLDLAKAKFSPPRQDISERVQYWEDRVRMLLFKQTGLNDKINEYDSKLQQLPQRQMDLGRLDRERVEAARTYSMLLRRRNESELLQSSESQNLGRIAEVLDPAIVPDRPVKPNKKKIAVLALAMGMMIGFGSAFMLEYFDRSFRSVDEAVNYLGVPVLAAIPRLTTFESELREKKNRRVKIVCIAVASLLVLSLIADIVSVEFFASESFFLNIARSGLNFLRRIS